MAENNLPPEPSPDDPVRPDRSGWISGPMDDTASEAHQLDVALPAARELLAGTVEAVNPGTSRRDLFASVTQYRKHLADLVAACSGADPSDAGGCISGPSISFEDVFAAEVTAANKLLLDDGTLAVVTNVRHGLYWLPEGLGQGVAIDWTQSGGSARGTLVRPPGDTLHRVTGVAR